MALTFLPLFYLKYHPNPVLLDEFQLFRSQTFLIISVLLAGGINTAVTILSDAKISILLLISAFLTLFASVIFKIYLNVILASILIVALYFFSAHMSAKSAEKGFLLEQLSRPLVILIIYFVSPYIAILLLLLLIFRCSYCNSISIDLHFSTAQLYLILISIIEVGTVNIDTILLSNKIKGYGEYKMYFQLAGLLTVPLMVYDSKLRSLFASNVLTKNTYRIFQYELRKIAVFLSLMVIILSVILELRIYVTVLCLAFLVDISFGNSYLYAFFKKDYARILLASLVYFTSYIFAVFISESLLVLALSYLFAVFMKNIILTNFKYRFYG